MSGSTKKPLQQLRQGLDRIDRVVWDGASDQRRMKKGGNRFLDLLYRLNYNFLRFLDWLDTQVFFRGRPYQAKACRVRSKAEKKLANFLTDHGIEFQYERPLQLGKVTLHPDFYLPAYGVYVEYWGLADTDPDYNRNRRAKLALYQKHQIFVISVFPRHLKKLERNFPQLFEEITGKKFPESS